MIPRVGEGGSSFKGAGLYYLHDKDAATSERVAFTHTLNLHTDNPETALKVMAWTAMHQNDLKRSAGVKATGRKLEKPVYTFSLSWAPDEKISKEEMIAAAKDSLKAIGMDDREVLLVAHSDTNCPHIHAIVNRVHPANGKAASTSRDHLILSRWAEAYERGQGKIRVHARVDNNERRKGGEFVKGRNLSRQEYDWLKAQYRRDPDIIRADREKRQAADRVALAGRLARRQRQFEGEVARTYGKARGALQQAVQTVEQRIGLPGFFRAVVRKLSGAEKRDHTSLESLRSSLGKIDQRIEERKGAMLSEHARDWEKMERRHASERMRDERLILRAKGESDGGRFGENMRKAFRAGGEGTPPAPTPVRKDSESGGVAQTAVPTLAEKVAEEVRRRRSRPRARERDRDHDR